MADHNDLGKLAEDLAVQFLQENGYKILVRNFRYQKAEIDIIAEKDHLIIVTEVKARSTDFLFCLRKLLRKVKSNLLLLQPIILWKNLIKIRKYDLILFLFFPTKKENSL